MPKLISAEGDGHCCHIGPIGPRQTGKPST